MGEELDHRSKWIWGAKHAELPQGNTRNSLSSVALVNPKFKPKETPMETSFIL